MEAKAQAGLPRQDQGAGGQPRQTQEKLNALQKRQGAGRRGDSLGRAADELENFRRKAAETRLALKEVRRELRADSEALQFWTKVLNIALMPLLVAIAGIGLAILRRRGTPAI